MQDKVSSRRMTTAFGETNNVVKFILKINQTNLLFPSSYFHTMISINNIWNVMTGADPKLNVHEDYHTRN